jgi:hypothetical protein
VEGNGQLNQAELGGAFRFCLASKIIRRRLHKIRFHRMATTVSNMAHIRNKTLTVGALFLWFFYFDFVKLFNHLEQAKGYTAGIAKNYTAGVTFSVPLRRTTQMSLPSEPLIYFVHVGKAGGATIYRELNMATKFSALQANLVRKKKALRCRIEKSKLNQDDKECYQRLPGETKLGALLMGRAHVTGEKYTIEERDWMWKNADLFIFSVRDPINRIMSAYNYHRSDKWASYLQKRFYKNCFPDGLDAMVDFVVKYRGTDKAKLGCQKRGLKALKGNERDRMGPHFKWGYRRYWQHLAMDEHPERTMAVIRTEFLWEDMAHLDIAVGGTGKDFLQEGYTVSHVSHKEYKSGLSPTNAKYLCCILHLDMDAYQTMILKAANLDATQKRETLESLLSHCEIEATGDILANPFSWFSFYENTCTHLMDL